MLRLMKHGIFIFFSVIKTNKVRVANCFINIYVEGQIYT